MTEREFFEQLIERAKTLPKTLHRQEKALVLESCQIIARLEGMNAAVNLGLTKVEYA